MSGDGGFQEKMLLPPESSLKGSAQRRLVSYTANPLQAWSPLRRAEQEQASRFETGGSGDLLLRRVPPPTLPAPSPEPASQGASKDPSCQAGAGSWLLSRFPSDSKLDALKGLVLNPWGAFH